RSLLGLRGRVDRYRRNRGIRFRRSQWHDPRYGGAWLFNGPARRPSKALLANPRREYAGRRSMAWIGTRYIAHPCQWQPVDGGPVHLRHPVVDGLRPDRLLRRVVGGLAPLPRRRKTDHYRGFGVQRLRILGLWG